MSSLLRVALVDLHPHATQTDQRLKPATFRPEPAVCPVGGRAMPNSSLTLMVRQDVIAVGPPDREM